MMQTLIRTNKVNLAVFTFTQIGFGVCLGFFTLKPTAAAAACVDVALRDVDRTLDADGLPCTLGCLEDYVDEV